MYTTLAKLKETKACTAGYGRMLSFFGSDKSVKEQKIPLSTVSLVGGYSDVEWTISNRAYTIDDADWQLFWDRNAVAMLRTYVAGAVTTQSWERQTDQIKMMSIHALSCKTSAEVDTFIKFWQNRPQSHNMWQRMFEEEGSLLVRHGLLVRLTSKYNDEISSSNFISQFDADPFQYVRGVKDKANMQLALDMVKDLAIDKPKAKKSKAQIQEEIREAASRETRLRRHYERDEDSDEEEGNEEEEIESSDDWDRVPKGKSTTRYLFSGMQKHMTPGQAFAFVLNEDPYNFMGQLKYKLPKGIALQNKDDAQVMSVTVSDAEKMFMLVRTMTMRGRDFVDPDNQ